MKSTYLTLIGLLMALVVLDRLRSRRYLDLASTSGALPWRFWLLWILAGQEVRHFTQFIRGAAIFSSTYNEALAVPMSSQLVAPGLVVIALFALANALRLWQFRLYRFRLQVAVFEAACLFIAWKHGYVRHLGFFFWIFVIPASPLLFLAHEKPLLGEGSKAPARASPKWWLVLQRSLGARWWFALLLTITLGCAAWTCHIPKEEHGLCKLCQPRAPSAPVGLIRSNAVELCNWPRTGRSWSSTCSITGPPRPCPR